MIWEKEDFKLFDTKEAVDPEQTYQLIGQTYWSVNRSRSMLDQLVEHSTCFSLYRGECLVGFVRVISDFTTTSWVADMVIDQNYQRRQLGYWMMECILAHPSFAHTQFVLQTKDAHGFYEKLGFEKRSTLMSTAVPYL